MAEPYRPEPWTVLEGYSSTFDPPAAAAESVYAGYRRLPLSPGTGKIGVLVFPQYLPTNDLVYRPRVDNPGTTYEDESVRMPDEMWSRGTRPPLVNFGGHRVGVVGEAIRFDASLSQFDEDVLPTRYEWFIDNAPVGTAAILTHTFTAPGLYTVRCRIGTTEGVRYVRILTAWGESDLDVVGIGSLNGSVDAGWQMSLDVRDTLRDLQPYQGILLYVYDTLDTSWRHSYATALRALDRRMKSMHELPPDPLWQLALIGWRDGDATYDVVMREDANPIALAADPWPAVDRYLDTYIQAQSRYGAPANLGRALAAELTGGNRIYPFGSSRVASVAETHVQEGMLLLAELFGECGNSWKRAIKAFIDGACGEDDTIKWDSRAGRVLQQWAWLDEVGGIGSAIVAANPGQPVDLTDQRSLPQQGQVLFFGYIDTCTISEKPNETLLRLQLVNSAEMLNRTYQRLEAYWESGVHATTGGTVMDGPPMRTATCIHHLLTAHTNFPTYHDVVLDYSGPRLWSTTAPEGTTWSAIQGWASNDYAWAYADRAGQLRYRTRPQYKGSQWYGEAVREAIRIDAEHVFELQIQELRMLKRTAYTRLCGAARGGNCEICGEYPCGGPPETSAGEWIIKRGLQYDDYRTLCRFAAYDFAYQNRSFDLQATLPWRHDLELGDLVFFPFTDPQGRFDWSIAAPPVFVVKAITHQYDVPSARWITTIQAEQLTYGVACDCDNATCPTAVDDGLCNGDIGCDVLIQPSTWKVEAAGVTVGERFVPDTVFRPGSFARYDLFGTEIATVYGEATELRRESVTDRFRLTRPGTVLRMAPSTLLTTVRQQSNLGSAISRSSSMELPYFLIRAKGPAGGTMRLQFKLRAHEARRAYVHLFYASTTPGEISETEGYASGQQVLLIGQPTAVREAPSATAVTVASFASGTLATVTGPAISTTDQRAFYPVVVDLGDFSTNDQAMIRLSDTPVRGLMTLSSGVVGTLPANTVVRVLTPPTAGEGVDWYRIQALGIEGWVLRDTLKNVAGWIDTAQLASEQGDDLPIRDAQVQLPADLRVDFDAFPKTDDDGRPYTLVRIATIEQYDYKLRDTRATDYVDTLDLTVQIPTRGRKVTYWCGMVATGEYGGQSWAPQNIPTTTVEGWTNDSTFDIQYGLCECESLQLTDLPNMIQQAIASAGPFTPAQWATLRTTLCQLFPPLACPETIQVNNVTYGIMADSLEELQALGGELVYVETRSDTVGAVASLELTPGCRDCFDPAATSTTTDAIAFGPKPRIFLNAGHSAVNDTGGTANERQYNQRIAQAYKAAFAAAGYTVELWQEVDGDGDPARSPGDHTTTASGIAGRMRGATESQLILLDLHHEGGVSASGVFAIVPTCGNDSVALNLDDMALARAIARNISQATGLPLRTGLIEPGVMGENQTGAAPNCAGRLAIFASTAEFRDRSVRLVIEHGNLGNGADLTIIQQEDFATKCANAAVTAVNQLYPASAMDTGCPNWPSLAAIEQELAPVRNGKTSPMKPYAADFLRWGAQYGINPAFVLALCFSESQYGTDDGPLGQECFLSSRGNNYGGHTYSDANRSFSGCPPYVACNRQWMGYCDPRQGAEALFKFLDKDIYRGRTDGTIRGIIDIYTPLSDNPQSVIDEKYRIIAAVGQRMGVTLDRATQVYANSALCTPTDGSLPTPALNPNYGGYTTMFQWAFKQAGARITQGPYMSYSHSQCDCYDFGVEMNTAVYPIAEGRVITADLVQNNYRPWLVIVRTRFGDIVYAHLNSVNVKVGQQVYLNTMIGRTGTCCDTIRGGPHLHLGLQGGKAGSTGGKYTLTSILGEMGINLSLFGRTY